MSPGRLLAAIAALALVACTASKSKVCRQVCGREAECLESRSSDDSTFDEGECVAACAALERDTDMKALVANHHDCVAKAATCPAVLACSAK